MELDDDQSFAKWLDERLREAGWGAAADLARHLDVNRSQITEWRKGNLKRGFTLELRKKIIGYYAGGQSAPELSSPRKTGGVIVIGRVGAHVWEKEEATTLGQRRYVGSPFLEYPLDEQVAYELLVGSRDGDLKQGDFVYTVPFENYRSKLLVGDEVVVSRRKGGLVSYALMRAVRQRGNVILVSMLDGQNAPDDPYEENTVGLVVGSFRPRSRRV